MHSLFEEATRLRSSNPLNNIFSFQLIGEDFVNHFFSNRWIWYTRNKKTWLRPPRPTVQVRKLDILYSRYENGLGQGVLPLGYHASGALGTFAVYHDLLRLLVRGNQLITNYIIS